jgi:dephospho-CoA kinase
MLKIGISGGIGSGKTTVCRIFETLDIPVYYADLRAKELYNENEDIKGNIKSLFGENIYNYNSKIDLKKIAEIVFKDNQKLLQLESIIHPGVFRDFEQFCLLNKSKKFIIKEAALLFESGSYKNLDKIIVMDSPLELRIKRTIARDHLSKEEIMARISRQWSDEQRLSLADYVIHNDEKTMLIPQVMAIFEQINILSA